MQLPSDLTVRQEVPFLQVGAAHLCNGYKKKVIEMLSKKYVELWEDVKKEF